MLVYTPTHTHTHTQDVELRLTCAEHYVKTLKEQLVEAAVQHRAAERRCLALDEQVP